jgi:tetratricopeptide (TPR) repeat protein
VEVSLTSTRAALIAVLLTLTAHQSVIALEIRSQTLKAEPVQRTTEQQTTIEECQRALSLHPRDADLWFRLAEIYSSQNKSQQALISYRNGLAVNPEKLSANENYARLLVQAGDFGAAVKPLQRVTRAEPGNMQAQLALIEAYRRSGRPDDAAARIDEVLPLATSQDQLELTRILIRMKHAERAQAILEGLVKSNSDLAEAHGQLGLLLMEKEQYESAALELGQAAQAEPESARYSLGVAEVLLRWHHYSTALEFLNGIKARFETLVQFQYDLAYAHYGLGHFEQAISTATALLKQDPTFAPAEFLLGNCQVSSGDLKTAEIHFERSIQLDATKPPYYAALAEVKRDEGKETEALTILKKGLALDPENTDMMFESALCYESEGQLTNSQAILERLVAVDAGLIRAHRLLLRVYGRTRNTAAIQKEQGVLAELEAREQANRRSEGSNQ